MLEELKLIIRNYTSINLEDINEDTDLAKDLDMNSYEFMSFVGEVEEAFDIEVDETEVLKIRTVGEVINYIKSLKE